ncbi:hypothetical protein [Sphingobium cloacae]
MTALIMAASVQFTEKVQHFRGNILVNRPLINRTQGVGDMFRASGTGCSFATRGMFCTFHIGNGGACIALNRLRRIPFRCRRNQNSAPMKQYVPCLQICFLRVSGAASIHGTCKIRKPWLCRRKKPNGSETNLFVDGSRIQGVFCIIGIAGDEGAGLAMMTLSIHSPCSKQISQH